MTMRTRSLVAGLLVAMVAGCATGSGGVVSTGPNTYMLGGQGGYFDLSGSAVKAKQIQDGTRFCADKGQGFALLQSSGQDSGFGTYASAEVHFRCIPR